MWRTNKTSPVFSNAKWVFLWYHCQTRPKPVEYHQTGKVRMLSGNVPILFIAFVSTFGLHFLFILHFPEYPFSLCCGDEGFVSFFLVRFSILQESDLDLLYDIFYILSNFGYNYLVVTIYFESHTTSVDNEAGLASGHFDAELSEKGIGQAKGLGERYLSNLPDVVFCSDLKRSFYTADIAFKGRVIKIIKDNRLRECDYGEFTRHPVEEVNARKIEYIENPFPGGESYVQTTEKMKSFLKEILVGYSGKTIMIIGTRATQYALENLVNKVDLKTAVTAPWAWRPGWKYELKEL